MGLNLVKLQEFQVDIEARCREEQRQNLTKELINLVLDKDFKRSFQGEKTRDVPKQSKRVLSHWVEKKIIQPEEREKDGGWFHFDRTESIWIDIVTQLREFGLSLDRILEIRESLFAEIADNFRNIDFCLIHSILKEPYLMVIYHKKEKGEDIGFITAQQYGELISTQAQPPHIVFSFYFLAKKIFPNNNFEIGQKDYNIAELNSAEAKLLFYLRTGDYQEIKIRQPDGEIYLLEATRKLDPKDRIVDIIQNAKYQNIEIKVDNDRIVYIKSTEKIKI